MKQNTIFSITEEDVQNIAIEKLGRKLNYDEIEKVKKDIGWGYVDWEQTVKFALDNLKD
jgi:hypothetical protein